LGQQFNPIEQALVQQGLSVAIAAKAVMGKLLAQIFDAHTPIFQVNFNSARVS
jgi:hypothetical protein